MSANYAKTNIPPLIKHKQRDPIGQKVDPNAVGLSSV